MTAIEWTDETWNPVTGCSKVSPGCKNCYAETIAKRFWKDRKFTDVRTHADRLEAPLHWKKPRRVFVNSMSDLFHEDVPDEFIDQVFAVMALCPQHTFQVLTKRAERMLAYCRSVIDDDKDLQRFAQHAAELAGSPCASGIFDDIAYPFPNVWIGVSVEDQQRADERIPLLLQTPAAVRFLSCEPLLGPVQLNVLRTGDTESTNGLTGERSHAGFGGRPGYSHQQYPRGIDWCIVGGESGHGARPSDLEWHRSLLRQCRAAGTAFFEKQLGSHVVCRNDDVSDWFDMPGLGYLQLGPTERYQGATGRVFGFNDKKGGNPEEWPADLRVREFPGELR